MSTETASVLLLRRVLLLAAAIALVRCETDPVPAHEPDSATSQDASSEDIGTPFLDVGQGESTDLGDAGPCRWKHDLPLSSDRDAEPICAWPIPEPPPSVDFDIVQIEVDLPDAAGAMLYRVADQESCAAIDAWFYDDPAAPRLVVLCPDTCQRVHGFSGAKLTLSYDNCPIP